MFSITRIIALILAFVLGFILGAGAFVGGIAIALAKFSLRDLENSNLITIPDEGVIGDNYEKDILDLTAFELYQEYQELQTFGDSLNLNLLQKRYDIIFNDTLNSLLTEETRTMPLKQLLSAEGVHIILQSVYIGNVEKYECKVDTESGPVSAKPGDEGAYWVTQDGKKILGIEEMIANWSLADFVDGKINTNDIFDELTIGDALGYEKLEDGWYDADGKKVTGVIASFADSTLHSIGDDLDDKQIGQLLGYEEKEDGWYKTDDEGTTSKVTGVMGALSGCNINGVDEFLETEPLGVLLGYEKLEDGTWIKTNDDGTPERVTGAMAVFADSGVNGIDEKIETTEVGKLLGYEKLEDGSWLKTNDDGTTEVLDGFMSKISDKNINDMDKVFETLVIGDIVKEEDRTGIFAIINPNTEIDNIGPEVNDSIKKSPLQFFMNEDLISFEAEQKLLLDNRDAKATISAEEYLKYYHMEGVYELTPNADGTYTIPMWRTKSLNESFSYILNIFTKTN